MVWVMGVSAFVGSYSLPLLEDPEAQANWTLTFALIPAIFIGVYFYNKKGLKTNGLLLGVYMFILTILLNALITVPLLIVPAGGSHLTFFGDLGFWTLGLEYVGLVVLFNWFIRRKRIKRQA